MTTTQAPIDWTPLINELQSDFAKMDRKLNWIAENTRPPRFHSLREFTLATANQWYPVHVPPGIKMWLIKAQSATPVLKIAFGTTDNLQESPPLTNYETIPANTPKSEFTSPLLIFLSSDTTNTVIEMEIWN
jgi:hypothetical protein